MSTSLPLIERLPFETNAKIESWLDSKDIATLESLPPEIQAEIGQYLPDSDLSNFGKAFPKTVEKMKTTEYFWYLLSKRDFSDQLKLQKKPQDVSWIDYYQHFSSLTLKKDRAYLQAYQKAYQAIPEKCENIGKGVSLIVINMPIYYVRLIAASICYQHNDHLVDLKRLEGIFNFDCLELEIHPFIPFTILLCAVLGTSVLFPNLRSSNLRNFGMSFFGILGSLSLAFLLTPTMQRVNALADKIIDPNRFPDIESTHHFYSIATVISSVVLGIVKVNLLNPLIDKGGSLLYHISSQYEIRSTLSHLYGKFNQFKTWIKG